MSEDTTASAPVWSPDISTYPRPEMERHFLSSICKDSNDVLAAVSRGICGAMFVNTVHAQLFDILADAVRLGSKDPSYDAGLAILKAGEKAPCSMAEWLALSGCEPTTLHAWKHGTMVIAYFKQAQLISLLKAAYHAANSHKFPDWDQCLEDATKHLSRINDLASDAKANGLCEMVDEYVAEQRDPLKARVTPIGITDWDRMAGSLREGELIVLAARPGMGKSALAMQTANSVMGRGQVVAYFSLEMTGKELVGRLAVHRAGRDGLGSHSREIETRINEALGLKKADKLFYLFEEQASRTLAAIEARSRLLAASAMGLGLIVVDYLQLIQVPQDMRRAPREQQVAELTRRLKLLANDLKCPILCLAQLNRSSEKEERAPRLSDLRESGAIEQDADRVWFMYAPDPGKDGTPLPGDAEIIPVTLAQAKCRNGRPGIAADLQFDRPISRFRKIVSTSTAP